MVGGKTVPRAAVLGVRPNTMGNYLNGLCGYSKNLGGNKGKMWNIFLEKKLCKFEGGDNHGIIYILGSGDNIWARCS